MIFPIILTCLAYVPYALSVVVKKSDVNENLIQLRDYDFVGEDKRLSALLSERLAMLSGTIDTSDLDAKSPAEEESATDQYNMSVTDFKPKLQLKPDHMELKLRNYPRVNVSLDYGEFLNISNDDFSMEVNSTWLGSHATPNMTIMLGHHTGNLTAGYHSGNLTGGNHTGNLIAGRRAPVYWDPNFYNCNMKVLEIMKQNIYSVQNKLIEIEPMIQRHQSDERFRIAYIFNRLDEWKRNIRTVNHAMQKYRWYRWRFKAQVWYYEHVLRINIDITYSVEFLIHLHDSFMKKMDELIPRAEREEAREMLKKRDEMKKMQMRPNENPFINQGR